MHQICKEMSKSKKISHWIKTEEKESMTRQKNKENQISLQLNYKIWSEPYKVPDQTPEWTKENKVNMYEEHIIVTMTYRNRRGYTKYWPSYNNFPQQQEFLKI